MSILSEGNNKVALTGGNKGWEFFLTSTLSDVNENNKYTHSSF